MKTLFTLLSISMMLFTFTGCDKKSDDTPSSTPDKNTTIPDLNITSSTKKYDGDWVSNSTTETASLQILSGSAIFSYIDPDELNQYVLALELQGSKTLQVNNIVVDKVLFTSTTHTITVITQSKVDERNANAACGFTDWEKGVIKDVGQCGVPTLTRKDIMALVNSDTIQFGDANDVDSNGYPNGLDAMQWNHK